MQAATRVSTICAHEDTFAHANSRAHAHNHTATRTPTQTKNRVKGKIHLILE